MNMIRQQLIDDMFNDMPEIESVRGKLTYVAIEDTTILNIEATTFTGKLHPITTTRTGGDFTRDINTMVKTAKGVLRRLIDEDKRIEHP